MGTVSASYQIIDALRIGTTFNVDYMNTKEFRYWSPESFETDAPIMGAGQMWRPENLRYNSNTMLSFTKTFNQVHNFDAAAVFEVMSEQQEVFL